MRLKFLFFPIILVISLSIFIGYIWPEIDNVKNLNKEKLASAQALQDVRDKQAAIESIGTQIANDSESKTTVNDYLPASKTEERIIGGTNYLAVDSGVSLVDVSLKSLNTATLANNQAVAATPSGAAVGGQTALDKSDGMQLIEATFAVNGNYEKIRLFIDQLQKIFLLNKIVSLTISSQEKDSNSPATNGSNANPTDLSAKIIMDFGYMSPFKLSANKIAKLSPELDKDTVSVLKQYVSQKTESVNSVISISGSRGKANPFLP